MKWIQRQPMMRWILLLLATACAASVWIRDRFYLGDHPAVASAPQPQSAEAFGLSDLSLLVPLQASAKSRPSESPFGHSGTGFCHAPTLDLGDNDPLMSREQWQAWAKDVLLAVLPLPDSDTLWSGKKPVFSDLYQEMLALPDVDTTGDCPDPVAADLLVQDVAALRAAGTNVATHQSLPRGVCNYRAWRVVSARFDPCPFQAKVLLDDPLALTPTGARAFPAAACGDAELRLVVQPFIVDGGRGYHAIDMALHLFFQVPDLAAAVTSLRDFKQVTRQALAAAGKLSPPADILQPHPGLTAEMDCGGFPLGDGGPAALGPVGKAWRQLLTTYGKSSRLFKVAWALSDNSGGNWSFGLRVLQPTTGERVLRRLEPFKVESFSAAALKEGMPFSPIDPRLNTLNYFYPGERNLEELGSPAGRAALGELINLANPEKTSFNLGGKLGGSCASCHARDFVERSVREANDLDVSALSQLAKVSHASVPIWEPFRAAIDQRNVNNLRQFGYGPGLTFGVSRRSLNEATSLARLFNDYAAGRWQRKAIDGAAKAQAELQAWSSPAAFAAESIDSLLVTRCGYCHGFKRGPDLKLEATAKRLACRIDAFVRSGPLDTLHMPPGMMLPPEELRQIEFWARQQPCASLPAGERKLDSD